MKTTKLIMTCTIAFALSGMTGIFAADTMPSLKKTPENVVKETRDVPVFTGISAGGAFEIFIKQTGTTSVVLEADQEIMEYIKTEVSGGILKIGMKKAPPHTWNDIKTLNVYVTVGDLNSLNLSGAVEISTENELKGEKLEMEISGAVETDLNLSYQEVDMELSGACEMDLRGKARKVNIEASGASEVSAFDFVVEDLSFYASGASDARVNVTGNLQVSASGACDVRYRGNASVNVHTSGASDVRKDD